MPTAFSVRRHSGSEIQIFNKDHSGVLASEHENFVVHQRMVSDLAASTIAENQSCAVGHSRRFWRFSRPNKLIYVMSEITNAVASRITQLLPPALEADINAVVPVPSWRVDQALVLTGKNLSPD